MDFLQMIKGDSVGLSGMIKKGKMNAKEGDIFLWIDGKPTSLDMEKVKHAFCTGENLTKQLYIRLGDSDKIHKLGMCKIDYFEVNEFLGVVTLSKNVTILEYKSGEWVKINMQDYWDTIDIRLKRPAEILEYL